MEDISSTFRPSYWGMPSSSSFDDSTAESECKLLSESVQTLKVIKCKKTAEIAHYGDIVNLHTKRPLELMSALTSSSESTANTHIGKPSSGFLVKPLIEVFSVSLDVAHMECSVRGTVKIDDMNCLYDRYLGSTESVLSYGSISLKRGCLIAADTEFCLKIDLRECSKSFNLGKGDIKLSKSEIEKYWNKRLCSVVKGEFGFVAVHYSPIKAALAAHVTVKFGCDGSTGTGKIYGSIVALYGGCADSTFHDKEYFRSRIFNRGPRSDEEDLEVNGDSPISVVTSTVAVPEGSSLIIQGSLHVGEKMNVYLEVDTFPDLCKSSRTIVGQNCYAEVSVMWELRNDEVVGLATGAEIVEEDIYGGTHVFGAPMVEVFSVRIRSCSEDTERPFEIYGQIRLTSGPDVFSIYNRDHWFSQTICQDGFLHLSGPHNLGSSYAGIMAVGPLSISMNLRDTICDTECKSDFNYSLLDGAKYDKGQSSTSDFATLYWAVIRVAVLATVEVSIAKWGEVDDGDIQVYGSVIADYGNNYHYQLSCPPGEEQNFRIALFDVPKSHPVPMIVGNPMRLSRYVVAVPSCSSLVVKADLWDGVSDSRIIHGKIAEFLACHKGTCTKSYRGIIQVKVTWDHRPSDIFPSTHANPYMTEALENIDEVHQLEIVRRQYGKITEKIGELRSPPLKIVRGPHGKVDDGKNMKIRELQCPPLHISQVSCGSHVPELSGCPRLEVFSIFIGGIDKNCKVYGTATVDLGFENILLYSRTKDDAELVSPYGTISMGFGHGCLIDGLDIFSMFIELKDVDDDDVAMVRGWVGMDFMELERRFYKRLCSIVRGPRCYAAVHYTTFCSAKGASLWVKFLPAQTSSDTMSVYGHLMAHYGGGLYSYDEPYAKAYYRITLFDRLGEDMAQVMADDGSIPLLKSLVAVPVVQKTSLVVWGYLFFCSAANGTIARAPIHVEMWPQPDDVTSRVELEGHNCSLEVGVKWVFW